MRQGMVGWMGMGTVWIWDAGDGARMGWSAHSCSTPVVMRVAMTTGSFGFKGASAVC